MQHTEDNNELANTCNNENPLFQQILKNAKVFSVDCIFSVGCQLYVKLVASKIFNSSVKSNEEFRVRVRQPNMNACIKSSGIITCTQAANDSEAKEGAMKIFQTL